jgi:hypothetical protein
MIIEDLRNMRKLTFLMRREIGDRIQIAGAGNIADKLKKAKQKMTIHLYPEDSARRQTVRRLIDFRRTSQIYLVGDGDDNFLFATTDGGSSGRRRDHNGLIDFCIDNNIKMPTMVVVTHHGRIASYYLHDNYSYIDHDVGSNWGIDILLKIKKAKLPKSYLRGGWNQREVWFEGAGKKEMVYRALMCDRFAMKLDLPSEKIK